MSRIVNKLLSTAAGAAALLASSGTSVWAGNIFITGHDDDYHDDFGSTLGMAQLSAAISFARNGSTLPVLTFDSGSELTNDLTALGIAYINVDPNVSTTITDSLFNAATYSAFVVASDYTCGGCDNSPTGEANIAAHSTAIDSFLNAGGGIVGFAGANSSGYYSFLPQTASSVGGAPAYGYVQTAVGAAVGIPAVNGDATHNLFYNPGINGESSFYQIAELNTVTGNSEIDAPAAVSLICVSCTTTDGLIVGPMPTPTPAPEPASLALLATGVIGAAFARHKRA